MKIGLDLHGVIDNDSEFFGQLSKDLVASGWEVHIITGPTKNKAEAELKNHNITYTHFFSIEDYHKDKNTPMTYDEKGNPWMDKETWDKTKGEYCQREGVRLHLDDTEKYKKYFKTSFATYAHLNKEDKVDLIEYHIVGNSYTIKEDLKANKCTWDSNKKCWKTRPMDKKDIMYLRLKSLVEAVGADMVPAVLSEQSRKIQDILNKK